MTQPPVPGQAYNSWEERLRKMREGFAKPVSTAADGSTTEDRGSGPAPASPNTEPTRSRPAQTQPAPDSAAAPVGTVDPEPGRRGYPGRAALDFGTTSATVTLWDPGETTYPSLSPVQRVAMGDAFARLLLDDAAGEPDELRGQWRAATTELAQRLLAADPVRPADAEAVKVLAERLGRRPDGAGPLLDALILELERLRTGRGGELRRFLTSHLDRCYDAGLSVLPLDTLRYFRVLLDGSRTDELDSVVYDTGRAGARRFSLLPGDGSATQPTAYRGLKQQLGRRVPRLSANGSGPTLDELIGGALGDLVHRTDTYLSRFREEHGFFPGALSSVVVTYPTMVPLSVRDKLRKLLLDHGIAKVETRFDEAIAAAMFFVLRELGGRFEMSVEAFAARSRAVAGSENGDGRPTRWLQNVMIVDVGGGTTDIALLRLELRDETDRTREGALSPHYGRYFRLLPTLLGTTGETQRGGDYLTLQVFRWIKVLIADHLLRHDMVGDLALDERYKDGDGHYLAGALVDEALGSLRGLRTAAGASNLVVPTGWRDLAPSMPGTPDARRQLFILLWDLAGRIKIDLGVSDEAFPDDQAFLDVWRMVHEMHAGSTQAPSPKFRLARSQFEHLVSAEVGGVMQLAAALATARLDGDRLDRVILTGRGALLPLVRRRLIAAFGAQSENQALRGGPDLGWHVGLVGRPDEYAKHAASIGACWAETVAQVPEQTNVAERLANGVTLLGIDVDNLFRTLRATFEVPGQSEGGSAAGDEIFSTGQQLRPLERGGEPVARSARWLQYTDPFQVQRRKIDRNLETEHSRPVSIGWAYFRIEDHLQRHPVEGFTLTPEQARQLFVQVETTANLDMTALVCCGDQPHISLPGGSASDDVHHRLTGESDAPQRSPLTAVPHDIVVNANVPGATSDGMAEPVFRAGAPFDRLLVVDEGADPIPAAVSSPLPAPDADGWRFSRRTVDETGGPVDRLLASFGPIEDADGLPAVAVLDHLGNLYVHPGEPPYRKATDLRDVFQTRGAVLRVPMTADDPDYVEADDPFTGLQ